jgi:4'-phosphopantetheinyl transferase
MPNTANISINTSFELQHDAFFNSDSKASQRDRQSLRLSYVCIDDIDLQPSEFVTLVDCLLPHEREKIMKYRLDQDRKRSLFSTLLQRKTIRDKLLCDDDDFEIRRTTEAKPFPVSKNREVGNWNYNVSHHGPYVGIVSHEDYITGADIVQLTARKSWMKGAISYIEMFHAQFTPGESRAAKSCATDTERYKHFFVNWSLKEAYVKAVGRGLGMDLQALHFVISFDANSGNGQCRGSAELVVHGRRMTEWSFCFQELDSNHVITVAKGPLHDVTQSYESAAALRVSQPKKHPVAEESPRGVDGLDKPPTGHIFPTNEVAIDVGAQKLQLDDLLSGSSVLEEWKLCLATASDANEQHGEVLNITCCE